MLPLHGILLIYTDTSKLQRIHRKFLAPCYNLFSNYTFALCIRRRQLDSPFLVNVYNGCKSCRSLLETFGIRVSSRKL
jgi:hypothetical protein